MLSINPEYADRILSGEKIYEFRKTRCRKNTDKIIIYSTKPVGLVVGEADIAEIFAGSPEEVRKIVCGQSSGYEDSFDEYYKNSKLAVVYKLSNALKYDVPRQLEEYSVKKPPRSFVYL